MVNISVYNLGFFSLLFYLSSADVFFVTKDDFLAEYSWFEFSFSPRLVAKGPSLP